MILFLVFIMNLNPSMMRKLMKQISAEQIPAVEVIIKTDAHDIVIKNPQVVKTKAMGVISYQVSGDEELIPSGPDITEEDVSIVQEQTGCTRDEAISALEETKGDIAEAIIKIKEE